MDERKVEGVDRKRKRRGIRPDSALTIGSARLAPLLPGEAEASQRETREQAQAPAAEPSPAELRADPGRPPVSRTPLRPHRLDHEPVADAGRPAPVRPAAEGAPSVAAARRRSPGASPTPEDEPERAAKPEPTRQRAAEPTRPPAPEPTRTVEPTPASAPGAAARRASIPAPEKQRAAATAARPKRKPGKKQAPEALSARSARHEVEAAPAEDISTAEPMESVFPVWAEWLRERRGLILAAAAGFLAGLLVYGMLGPGEPAVPERAAVAQRLPERGAPDSILPPSPETPWSPPGVWSGTDSGYRPPPPAAGYPSTPTYPPASTYPRSPGYPTGPAYPMEDYRPWGRADSRADSRSERPREAPPGTLGGYPSTPSPYVPFSPAR